MKTLVTYLCSGQTRKVAEAIYEALPGEKEIREMGEVGSLRGYDLTFVGFAVEENGPEEKVIHWLAEKAQERDIALFITHTGPISHTGPDKWLDLCSWACKANIIDLFDYQSEASEADGQTHETMSARPWTLNHPTEEELTEVKSWTEDVLRKI